MISSVALYRWFWHALKSWQIKFATILLITALCLSGGSVQATSVSSTIYFYNPESNVNNFATLKKNLDDYFSKFGNFQFQPFSDRATFEKHVESKGDGIYLVSSWHYKRLKKKLSIQPALVGVYKSKSVQRSVLTSKSAIKTLELLKGRTLASAAEEGFAMNILRSMLGKEKIDIANSITLLTVPKDIDALMAVGFGMAECALTSDRSLAKLSIINPKQAKSLNTLAKGGEELLPIIAVLENSTGSEGEKELLKIIENMAKSPDGSRKLKLLGLDGWKKLGQAELDILER